MTKVKSAVRSKSPAQRSILPPPRFGSHLSIAGGVVNAIRSARELSFDTVQIFVKNQRQWAAPPLKAEDVADWHKAQQGIEFGPTVAHATYLINLASGDDVLHAKSRDAFADELLRCDALGIPYLVVHPGASGEQPRETAMGRVASALNEIFKRHPAIRAMPLLETTAGQGSTLGRRFGELAEIIRQIGQPERVGVCVDTCHVFAAGYDIRQRSGYAQMIQEAAGTVGLDRIRCWHLNDSKGACGSRLDRHEHIGHGALGDEAFEHVVRDPRWSGIPMILETPKEQDEEGRDWDRINLTRLKVMGAPRISTQPNDKPKDGRKRNTRIKGKP